jgi:HK97 gp10 family phage protein
MFPAVPVTTHTGRATRKIIPKTAITRGKQTKRTTMASIEIVGLNTVIEHFDAVNRLWFELPWAINNFTGELVTHNARQIVPISQPPRPPTFYHGATRDSIHHTLWTTPQDLAVDIGPTTFYSRYLEFGTANMSPKSFMIPAADMVEVAYINAMLEVAQIANQLRTFSPPFNRAVSTPLSRLRAQLYSVQKAMGDVIAIAPGLRPMLSPFRSNMLSMARTLGDVSSLMSGTLLQRVQRRLRGRLSGRLIGVGSVSFSHGANYSAFIGGPIGHRIYQRVAGRYTNIGFVGTQSPIGRMFG